MARCLISLGANLGNPLETIGAAAELLRGRLAAAGDGFQLSRFFRTPPVGGPTGQPPFVNAVLATETRLSSNEVWLAIRAVEQSLGRQRDRRWEARSIDLDILLFENERVWTPQLKIPHPRMCMRRFILLPAMDVASGWIDPVSQQSISQLADAVYSGPGSILLIADEPSRYQSWLQTIARQTQARIVALDEVPVATPTRWLALASSSQFRTLAESPPRVPRFWGAKLAMFLGPTAAESASDGEATNPQLLESLNLRPGAGDLARGGRVFPAFDGPRYWLATDDGQWAIHEIVSALEAMDCPVEPIAQA